MEKIFKIEYQEVGGYVPNLEYRIADLFSGFVKVTELQKEQSKSTVEIEEVNQEKINEIEDELLGDYLIKLGLNKINQIIRHLKKEELCKK